MQLCHAVLHVADTITKSHDNTIPNTQIAQ